VFTEGNNCWAGRRVKVEEVEKVEKVGKVGRWGD